MLAVVNKSPEYLGLSHNLIERVRHKYQASIDRVSKWPRVWGVEDTSLVDLSTNTLRLSYSLRIRPSFIIFSVISWKQSAVIYALYLGILLGQSESADRPRIRAWSGQRRFDRSKLYQPWSGSSALCPRTRGQCRLDG